MYPKAGYNVIEEGPQQQPEQQEQKQIDSENSRSDRSLTETVIEESKGEMSVNDPNDPTDLDFPDKEEGGGEEGEKMIVVEQVIKEAMLDNQWNNKGYFTKDDLVFTMQMLPNERWTEKEYKQHSISY